MTETLILKERLATRVVTLDMDGTMEDPWACCRRRDRTGGTRACRHLRVDTLAKVERVLRLDSQAKLVILSWRNGLEQITREWLAWHGVKPAAVFVPGSADSLALGARDLGQVGFKLDVVQGLEELGSRVVCGFDDNSAVVNALNGAGAAIEQVPWRIDIDPVEWSAGRIMD